MSRNVCFFDETDGQTAICIQEEMNCCVCNHNPFPGKIVPEDRVLRRKRIMFEYEPLTDEECAEMKAGRVYERRTRSGRPQQHSLLHHYSRRFHHRHGVRR